MIPRLEMNERKTRCVNKRKKKLRGLTSKRFKRFTGAHGLKVTNKLKFEKLGPKLSISSRTTLPISYQKISCPSLDDWSL